MSASITKNASTAWTLDRIITVLHVDDDISYLQSVKGFIETDGRFQVDSASSVLEAKSKLKLRKYDVILSDYQMPQKTGLEFLTELRCCGIMTPFILVADREKTEVVIKALNLGVFRYIEKHSDSQKLWVA